MGRLHNIIALIMLSIQLVLCCLFLFGVISPFYLIGIEFIILYLMLFIAKPKVALMLFLFLRPLLDFLKPYSDIQTAVNDAVDLINSKGKKPRAIVMPLGSLTVPLV